MTLKTRTPTGSYDGALLMICNGTLQRCHGGAQKATWQHIAVWMVAVVVLGMLVGLALLSLTGEHVDPAAPRHCQVS